MLYITKQRLAGAVFSGALLVGGLALLYGSSSPPTFFVGGAGTARASSAAILFTGDLMFDRTIRTALERVGAPERLFEGVSALFSRADAVVGNLEGPVTHFASVSEKSVVGEANNTRFTFPTFIPKMLYEKGFRVVSIGNNHAMDFGREGVEETKENLGKAGIGFVGDPLQEDPEPFFLTVKGFRVAFVGYNDFINPNAQGVRAALRAARDAHADFVVLLAHWGEEYEALPPERIKILARSFVAAGADLVIGTHPHVRGAREELGLARVYYSLGNFVFDQYWDASVRCGRAVKLSLQKEGKRTVSHYEEFDVGLLPGARVIVGCEKK